MALIDNAISSVNSALLANLPWLDNAFGKVQRMKREDAEGKTITFPGIYVNNGKDNYRNLLPDRELGNYSYFEVPDPVEYEIMRPNVSSTFKFKIVFWFKWSDIWPNDWQDRSIEEVKALILDVLMAAHHTRTVSVFQIFEDVDSVFQNFTHQGYISSYVYKQYAGQFLMKPYGALAFTGEIRTTPSCVEGGTIPSIPADIMSAFPLNYSNTEQVYWLKKWYGDRIYWRTWPLDTGVDGYENLTGLVASDVFVVDTEYRAINSVSGKIDTGKIQLEPNGSGGYKVRTLSQHTDIFVTVYYTKL